MAICKDCGLNYDELEPWHLRLGCSEERCWECNDDFLNAQEDSNDIQETPPT